MNRDSAGPSMRQRIFSMNLKVEAVSLYLLCCAVADAGANITLSVVREKWNGDPSVLEREFDRLEKRNIVRRMETETGEDPVYRMVAEKNWR